MEVTPHLIHQEKTFHPGMRQKKNILPTLGKRIKRTGGAFQLCRQHCNACDTESCDTGTRPVTELAGRARVLWQSYFSLE